LTWPFEKVAPRQERRTCSMRQASPSIRTAVTARGPKYRRRMRSYGSVPGELAACVRHVGLVRRSDLTAMRASGDPRSVEAITARLTGLPLAPGGSVHLAGASWCRPDAERLLLIGAADALPRSVALLRTQTRRHPDLVLDADLDRLAVIGVVGRRTARVLRELGIYGPFRDQRDAAPCAPFSFGTARTVWLLESDVHALCCVDRADAAVAEKVIALAGRPLGLARVGQDAVAQYLLLERRRAHAELVASA
jgi:hypothetical protein